MAKAKKLPSGNWRCLVYSHTEKVRDPKTGQMRDKKIYRSFTDTTKKKAELAAALFLTEKDTKTTYAKMTFGEALDDYINRRSSILSPSTIKEYKRSRRCDFAEIENKNIYEITQEDIQTLINHSSAGHSPKTVRNIHGLIAAVFGAYRPDFRLKTDFPGKVRPSLYIPSEDDIAALLAISSGTEMEIPIYLAAFGPMRRGEIAAINYDTINDNSVYVEYNIVKDENNNWVRKTTKSYAGNRMIIFPGFVMEKIKSCNGDIVHLNPTQITCRFEDLLKDCGLPHFRFHDLRHYAASMLHALGMPDSYIMERGGWGNDGTLKAVYRHVMEDKRMEVNNRANEYFSQRYNTKYNTGSKKAAK